jgi:hypothetical protein
MYILWNALPFTDKFYSLASVLCAVRLLSTGMNHNKVSALSSSVDKICGVRMDMILKYDYFTKKAQNKTPESTCLNVVDEWLSSYRLCYVRLSGYHPTAYVTCGWVVIILPLMLRATEWLSSYR